MIWYDLCLCLYLRLCSCSLLYLLSVCGRVCVCDGVNEFVCVGVFECVCVSVFLHSTSNMTQDIGKE